jgi:methylenetetrahydrofolate--tRNA-(uracil-5-)-methyltransferase
LLAGRFAAAEALGGPVTAPPATTALGALIAHITGGHLIADDGERSSARSFQPMNINYGLIPDLDAAPVTDASGKKLKGAERGRAKKQAMSRRALTHIDAWITATHFSTAAE